MVSGLAARMEKLMRVGGRDTLVKTVCADNTGSIAGL